MTIKERIYESHYSGFKHTEISFVHVESRLKSPIRRNKIQEAMARRAGRKEPVEQGMIPG